MQLTETQYPPKHFAGLDELRGLAILLVLLRHFGQAAGVSEHSEVVLLCVFSQIISAGWIGVDLFFVLSGFLITTILLSSAGRKGYFRNFYTRRALRILPVYFSSVLIGVFLIPLVLDRPDIVGQSQTAWGWLVAFLPNVATAFGIVTSFGFLDILWSVAVEEHFYIAWPLIVMCFPARSLGRICIFILLVTVSIRLYWLHRGGSFLGAYVFTATRLDGLAVGSWIACRYFENQGQAWLHRSLFCPILFIASFIFFAMLVAVHPFCPTNFWVIAFGPLTLALFFGGMLTYVVQGGWLCSLLVKVKQLRWLGKYRYGIYVWHYLVLCFVGAVAITANQANTILGIGLSSIYFLSSIYLSLLAGWLSWHAIERPFLNLKSKYPVP